MIIVLFGSMLLQGHTLRDWQALTTTLYFEGAVNESTAGLWAIGNVVMNRIESGHYPDSVYDVMAEGVRGQSNGGCQFSFMCDGLPERTRTLAELPARAADMERYWGETLPYEKRWLAYSALALVFLAGGHLYDLTANEHGQSTLYWTGATPYWSGDCKGEPMKIGSHFFCPSRKRGSDIN